MVARPQLDSSFRSSTTTYPSRNRSTSIPAPHRPSRTPTRPGQRMNGISRASSRDHHNRTYINVRQIIEQILESQGEPINSSRRNYTQRLSPFRSSDQT